MSKKTLNQSNLEALGANQLAALLIEVSAGSADIKRRLRLELSHNLGATELAHDVRKRLLSLRKSKSFVGWRKRKALVKDLETQVKMIVEKIAPHEPTLAFDLLWDFIEIAPSIYGRVDDSKGDVGDVFRAAIQVFDDIAPRAVLDTVALADRMWIAIQDNTYGEWDGIIPHLVPALGDDGIARLTANVAAFAATPPTPNTDDHAAIQFLRQLRSNDGQPTDRKSRFVKACLQEIAAASGDTKAYIAQYSTTDLQRADTAAEVAMLYLTDDRAIDALDLLRNADDGTDEGKSAWNAAYIACLTALGRIDDAQTHRWTCFTKTLNPVHLRDHLKLLPDFVDTEAEDRAKQHVLTFPVFSTALDFCLTWPDLLTASRLIDTRTDEINGDHTALLTTTAEALRSRHPLCAVLIWRAMIENTLDRNQVFRYADAADHLANCAIIDTEITDYGRFLPHGLYLHNLRTRHDRNSTFWAKMIG